MATLKYWLWLAPCGGGRMGTPLISSAGGK